MPTLRRLIVPALLAFGLASSGCIVRAQPHQRQRRSVKKPGKHRHHHCHRRGARGKRQCHSHPHTHPHH